MQLSLDKGDLNEALDIVEETRESVDIVEVGTPLALRCGAQAIAAIKERYPGKQVLADFKIMDGGEYEAGIAFEAGADIVTVLGAASDATIGGAVSAARRYKKETMVDLIEIADIRRRLPQIEKLGADYLCVHTAVDVQNGSNSPMTELLIARQIVTTAKLAIAGGLNIRNIGEVIPGRPDIVIVGAGITSELNRGKAAADIRRKLREAEDDRTIL